VVSDELTRERPGDFGGEQVHSRRCLRLWDATQLGFFRRRPLLEIPELHDYLTDAANWNAPTWAFELEGQQRLARTLSWLYVRMPEGFRFSATWGPVSLDEQDVDRHELLAIVKADAISTCTVYNVRAA
jgi:hypothetical protein